MKINIAHMGPQEWFNFKADILYGLLHSLTALGHEVSLSHNQFIAGRHNLVVGADWLAEPAQLAHIRQPGLTYSVYDVEAFDGATLNGRKDFDLSAYLEVLQRAQQLITPYRYNLQAYQQHGLSGKALYAPWGYFPQLLDANIDRRVARQFNAVFFGLAKGEREHKLQQLAQVTQVRLVSRHDPVMSRAWYLSASRFGLSLASGADEPFVNPFRLYLMVANGVPVLADNPNDLDGYLELTAHGDFSDVLAFFQDPAAQLDLHANLGDGRQLASGLAAAF